MDYKMLRYLTDTCLIKEYINELEEIKKYVEINNIEYERRCKKRVDMGYTKEQIDNIIVGLFSPY